MTYKALWNKLAESKNLSFFDKASRAAALFKLGIGCTFFSGIGLNRSQTKTFPMRYISQESQQAFLRKKL
jgi:hypothetical protein